MESWGGEVEKGRDEGEWDDIILHIKVAPAKNCNNYIALRTLFQILGMNLPCNQEYAAPQTPHQVTILHRYLHQDKSHHQLCDMHVLLALKREQG